MDSLEYNPKIYDLVPPNDEILRKKTEPFDFDNPPVNPEELAYDLVANLRKYGGVGLSANQIGLPYRVFVMRGDPHFVCFNPRIVDISEETIKLEESCLTFPNLELKVERPRHIKVRFNTPNGDVTTKTFTGLTARCFLHELQHLNGEFFFKGVGRLSMEKALKKANKSGYDYTKLNLMKEAINNG